MITKEQIWYISRVYPEAISQEEAKKEYDETRREEEDFNESYWQAAANAINKLS